MNLAQIIFTLIIMLGSTAHMVPGARVTVYIPSRGPPIECQEPCSVTASGRPVEYGVTAACGPSIPFGTHVYVNDIGWFECWDRGGGIGDEDIDLAARETDWWANRSGHYDVVFVRLED